MDPEMEELKELVRTNIKLSQDTNRLLHGMRRAAWWGRAFRLLWWVAIVGVSVATYYLYLGPYLEQIQALYQNIQSGAQSAQNFQGQVGEFFKNFTPQQPK